MTGDTFFISFDNEWNLIGHLDSESDGICECKGFGTNSENHLVIECYLSWESIEPTISEFCSICSGKHWYIHPDISNWIGSWSGETLYIYKQHTKVHLRHHTLPLERIRVRHHHNIHHHKEHIRVD